MRYFLTFIPYSLLLEFYEEIFDLMQLNFMVTASKAIGGLIIIIMLLKMVFKSYSENGKIFSTNTDSGSNGFSPYQLLRMLFLLLLIGFSTNLLSAGDSIMGVIEEAAFDNMEEIPSNVDNILKQEKQINIDELDFFDKILNNLNEIIKLLNPVNWIGWGTSGILYIVLEIIEMLMYPLFLMHRFFIMGLIKIFFPLMIALSIFDKMKDYIFEIMKVYLRTYLVIIPWMFVTIFGNTIVTGIIGKLNTKAIGTTNAVMTVSEGMIWLVLMLMLIFFKFKAYGRSREFMKEIIK